MDGQMQKLFFELSLKEKRCRLQTVLATEMERVRAMNLPITYRNKFCVKPSQFIHEYPNGRIELVEINIENSQQTVIKILKEND